MHDSQLQRFMLKACLAACVLGLVIAIGLTVFLYVTQDSRASVALRAFAGIAVVTSSGSWFALRGLRKESSTDSIKEPDEKPTG